MWPWILFVPFAIGEFVWHHSLLCGRPSSKAPSNYIALFLFVLFSLVIITAGLFWTLSLRSIKLRARLGLAHPFNPDAF